MAKILLFTVRFSYKQPNTLRIAAVLAAEAP